MIAQDEILDMGRNAFDFLVQSLDVFGNEAIARVFAFVLVLCLAVLLSILGRAIWVLCRHALSTQNALAGGLALSAAGLANVNTPKSMPSEQERSRRDAVRARTNLERSSVIKSIEGFSNEVRTALVAMSGDLAKEKSEHTARVLQSQTDMEAAFARIESVLNGMVAKINASRSQVATIEVQLESLHMSVIDIGERLADGEQAARLVPRATPEKLKAEIADIVRDLQEV